jgi:CRP/FNR family transcriptional regulator, cyclic AMP receptor protein
MAGLITQRSIAIASEVHSDAPRAELMHWLAQATAPSADHDVGRLEDHAGCSALSGLFRGRVCERLAAGPGRRLQAGEFLYMMGNPANSVYLVRRGLVKTSLVSARGQERTLRIYPAGEILGELCLCAGERREQAVVLEPSEVVEIPLTALLRQLRQEPQAALEFASAVCAQLADAHEGLRSLSFDTVGERLARTLFGLAQHLGKSRAGRTRIAHYITQEELARMIGARREVVSGLLNRFRDQGLISYTRRGLIEVDGTALKSYIDSISEL